MTLSETATLRPGEPPLAASAHDDAPGPVGRRQQAVASVLLLKFARRSTRDPLIGYDPETLTHGAGGLKMRAWVVRAGSNGEREGPELSRGIVAAGWPELRDITAADYRGALRAALERTFSGYSPRVIGNWAGQLWRFRQDISAGDLVVLPRRSRQLALGRITGHYEFASNAGPRLAAHPLCRVGADDSGQQRSAT